VSRPAVEERIAQLQAQAQAQRLAAQLAIFEARDQLAPLKSAAGVIGMAVHALSPGGTAAGAVGKLTRFGIGHPWLTSTAAGLAWRLLRGRPMALLIAAAAGGAAWWLLRPAAPTAAAREPPA
jgi:hypothetical protein